MQFRQVDVYTKSEAIQVLVMRLSELGLNGFIIHDPADFEEFLENKEYNWDYVDDSLMGLKTVEPHITCYVQDNEQGAEMLSALGGTLDELKENDTDDFYGSLDVTIDCVREEDWALETVLQAIHGRRKADSKAELGGSREYRRQKDT